MEETITLAVPADTESLLALYHSHIGGPAGWHEGYPNRDTIAFDTGRDALYVMKDAAGQIIACVSIDADEDADALPCWSRLLQPGLELSRLCVRTDLHRRHLASTLLEHVLGVMQQRGMLSARLLVRPEHTGAQRLYTSLGFAFVGECHLYEHRYLCMEKAL